MRRKGPTLLVLAVSVLYALAYWLDMKYNINPTTGFVENGSVWLRYVLLLMPFFLAIWGTKSLGSLSMSTLRRRNPALGVLMLLTAASGVAYGIVGFVKGFDPYSLYTLFYGFLFIWYGGWMFMAGVQMFRQDTPSPTTGVLWGIVAAMPFFLQTVYRMLVNPSSLYRISSQVSTFSSLFSMLWVGMLLRGFYIAMLRSRARDMYLIGHIVFLLNTLEFTQTLYASLHREISLLDKLEGLNMGLLGLLAAAVGLSLSGHRYAQSPLPPEPPSWRRTPPPSAVPPPARQVWRDEQE